MNIQMYNGKKTTSIAVQAETYEDIARFLLEQEGFYNVTVITTALMARVGWYKNPIFVGWFKLKFTEVKEKREYSPCLSFYINKRAG